MSIEFNVPSNVNAASANALVHFLPDDSEFDEINLFADALDFEHTNGVLDSNPQTWQELKIEAPVPPGTRSLLIELSYGNTFLGGNPGYVDTVKLNLKMKKLPKCHGIPITSGCEVDGVGPTLCMGNNNSNVIIGTSQADVIVGGKKNDVIRGRGGDDVICGNQGSDRLFGNAGDDVLIGGRGDDTLKGNAGDDHLKGGKGKDDLFGGPGYDTLEGDAPSSSGADFCNGQGPGTGTCSPTCEIPPGGMNCP